MEYKKDFSVDTFEFWSGARDTIKDIENAGLMDKLQTMIETAFDGEIPTETQINDMVWFDRDFIYENLGLDENGKPIKNDEDDESEDDEDDNE